MSWYEAAAYAAFAGKNLPSLYHWYRVADPRISVIVGPVSNIGGKRVAKVGQSPYSEPFGAFDMFGNVKGWVFNQAGNETRFILGGAANEFVYQAIDVDARSPWDRQVNHGFRRVRYLKPPGLLPWGDCLPLNTPAFAGHTNMPVVPKTLFRKAG